MNKFLKTSMQAVKESMKKTDLKVEVSRGNSKLKKDKIASWNIIAGFNCPGAGSCAEFCYAKTGFYYMPGAMSKRADNFIASKQPDFVLKMINHLDGLPKTWRYIRVHDSGDFYDQGYVDQWVDIATCCPDKQFYAYTKSLHLDFSELQGLPNFNLIQSVGGKFDDKIDYSKPHSRIFNDLSELNNAGYVDCSKSDLPTAKGAIKVGLIVHGQNKGKFAA